MKREAINIMMTAKEKKAFRLKCILADYTMQAAADWLILQVIEGKIQLPERKLP